MGHLVNSIKEIPEYLERGSNVLESDVKFFKNGSVKAVHHGFPCDCGRECENSANLANYLQTVRNITDPNTPGNYYNQLVMQFFDLKLNTSEDKRYSGREIARHVLDYLWGEAGEREQEIEIDDPANDVPAQEIFRSLRGQNQGSKKDKSVLFAFLLHISFLGFGWKRVAINSGPKNPKDLLKKRLVRRHNALQETKRDLFEGLNGP
ncbi:dermonecrotic toxin SdSicTox-betaIIB1bvi [Trichonephila clavipes]|nr:dermonecrotic toxin SdSicTox-betaIIB1bvi [Trichonephila clavipes]